MSGVLQDALGWTIEGVNRVVIGYFLLVNGFYLMLMISALFETARQYRQNEGETYLRQLASDLMPRISMVVPAHNEAATVVQSVQALLTLSYPDLEVVVVDDGSTDGTLAVLTDSFGLFPVRVQHDQRPEAAELRTVYRSRRYPNLVLAAKAHGGKAEALNAGLDVATGELVCAVDADTIIDVNALKHLVQPFLFSEETVAAGATIRIVNGCLAHEGRVVTEKAPQGALAGIQAVEYLRSFLFGRVGWNRIGGNLVVSGAFGLFRRDALIEAGGYARTVGEDMELVVRLRRLGYERRRAARVAFLPDPIAWTEAPGTLRALGRQRDRWHRGLTDTLWRHRDLFGNPRYGVLGTVVIPTFVVVEWLAPIVEAVGLLTLPLSAALGYLAPHAALLFFAVAYGLGTLNTVVALLLEELTFLRYGGFTDRLSLVGWAVLENVGYRQLTVYWRLRGIVRYLCGHTDWGVVTRHGFRQPATPDPGSPSPGGDAEIAAAGRR